MKRTTRMVAAVSTLALVTTTTSPAWAAGTTAGDTITNNVSVSFDVGGTAQTAVTAFDTFTVDRKVDVTVAELGGTATTVAPGQTQAAITFQVTNLSNDIVDLNLSVVQSATDNGDITNIKYFIDDGDGVFGAGDTEVTYLDQMAEDATVVVHVVGDIPGSLVTGNSIDVALVANAHSGDTAGALGAELVATTGANTAGIDTVLADGAGDEDIANQGDFSDTDSYVVAAAALSVSKSSSIYWDPVNLTNNPKAIPGAIIEYCITVSNGAGSALAESVSINDVLPADVSYDATYGIFVDGDASCANGTRGDTASPVTANYDSGNHEVNGDLSDIAATVTRSLYFRVTID